MPTPRLGGADPGRPTAHHSIRSATAVVISASSSGSVIGVACRYSTFGLKAKTAAPLRAARGDPVSAAIIHAMAAVAIANDTTEIATADAPLRYSASTCTGSRLSRCGKGSHTAPICCQPGVRLSITRRATTRWPRES